jgi:glycosyltransferase 2 family protein
MLGPVAVDPQPSRDAAAPASASPSPSLAGRIARVLLGLVAGLAVAGGIGYWKGVRPDVVARYVAGVSPWVLVGCALSSLVIVVFQALRWHLVMSPLLGLAYGQAYRAQMVGQLFNAFIPARGGDLLRVQYLGRRSGKSRATILGTEVVDRWLDWWGWIPLLLVLSLVSKLPAWLYGAMGGFCALLVGWAGAMLYFSRRGWEPRPGSRFGAIFKSFLAGIGGFKSRRMLAIAVAVAPLCWAWEVGALVVAGHAFGIELTPGMAFSVLIAFNLATALPSPGGIGVVEAGGSAALIFFGVDQERALAFMFVYHFTQLLPAIVGGMGILVVEGEHLFGKDRARVPAGD